MLDYLQLYPETIKQLKRYSKEERCNLYEAMAEYAFTGQEPDWPDNANEWFIWETLKQQVNRTEKKVVKNRANATANSQPEPTEAKPSESKPTGARQSQPEPTEAKPIETHNQESDTEKEIKNNDNSARVWASDSEIKEVLARDSQIEDAAKSAGLNVSEMNMVKAREYARVYGMDKLLDAIAKTAHGAERITWAYVEGVLKNNGRPEAQHRGNHSGNAGNGGTSGKYAHLFDGTAV